MEIYSNIQEIFSVPFGTALRHSTSMQWWQRLQEALARSGWTAKELSRRSNVDEQRLYKYLQGKVAQPRGRVLESLAESLGLNPLWLREGLGPELMCVPMVGVVGAGERFTPIPAPIGGYDKVDISFQTTDPIAVTVRGDSMLPVYRHGDILVCSRRYHDWSDCYNRDCIVLTENREGYIKKVERGRSADTVTLASYNAPVMHDQKLRWCAPVEWVRRVGW